jgi:hypothetical protein
MNIDVLLMVFATDNGKVYVMLHNLSVPRRKLGNTNSFTVVEEIIKESMNISGRWNESEPKLVGLLDEPHRLDVSGNRLISIVYNLCLPIRNNVSASYQWINLADIDGLNMSDENKNVIRYASINI